MDEYRKLLHDFREEISSIILRTGLRLCTREEAKKAALALEDRYVEKLFKMQGDAK